jgi:hypothetical protein
MPPSTGVYFVTKADQSIQFVGDGREKLYLFTRPFAQDAMVSPPCYHHCTVLYCTTTIAATRLGFTTSVVETRLDYIGKAR